MPDLTLKEEINALFDEDFRQKLYDLAENEDDVNKIIRYLTEDLEEWRDVMSDEFYTNDSDQ